MTRHSQETPASASGPSTSNFPSTKSTTTPQTSSTTSGKRSEKNSSNAAPPVTPSPTAWSASPTSQNGQADCSDPSPGYSSTAEDVGQSLLHPNPCRAPSSSRRATGGFRQGRPRST